MFLLLQGDIFRFHASFRGCNHIYFSPSGDVSILENDIAPEKNAAWEKIRLPFGLFRFTFMGKLLVLRRVSQYPLLNKQEQIPQANPLLENNKWS